MNKCCKCGCEHQCDPCRRPELIGEYLSAAIFYPTANNGNISFVLNFSSEQGVELISDTEVLLPEGYIYFVSYNTYSPNIGNQPGNYSITPLLNGNALMNAVSSTSATAGLPVSASASFLYEAMVDTILTLNFNGTAITNDFYARIDIQVISKA